MIIKAKQITEAEAIEIMSNQDSAFCPYRVINEAGKMHVANWVSNVAEREHKLDAWFTEAENAANNASVGESIIIEMCRSMTNTGNPQTLNFDSNHFDWMINE